MMARVKVSVPAGVLGGSASVAATWPRDAPGREVCGTRKA